MKIQLIGETKTIMSNPDSRHNYFAWPSVARLQNGKIAVAASGFRLEHVCPFGKTVIAFSEDEGETYTAPIPVIDTVLDDRDGGLCTFGDSGLIVTSFNNTVRTQRKWNEQRAKSAYIDAYLDTITPEEQTKCYGSTFRISHDCGITFGPIHKIPITSPHGPIQLKDGSILYVGTDFDLEDVPRSHPCLIQAYRVNLDGTSEFLGQVPPIEIDGKDMVSCEPYAFQLEDGTILCHIRTNACFDTFQTESTDGGKTWTVPRRIFAEPGGAPAHIMQHSSGALISVYSRRKQPYGIRVAFSYDGGKTWDSDHPLYINEATADLGYPATVELHDGTLLTVFYAHTVKGTPAVIMQQKWSFTKD